MEEDVSFGEFLGRKLYESEITIIELSWLAEVSAPLIYKILRGEWEDGLSSRGLGNARMASSTLTRLVKAVGEDPQPWLEKLGLPRVKRFRKVALNVAKNRRCET